MAFQAFRTNGAPTFYESIHTPWHADLVTGGLIFCFVILAISFLFVLPGISGKERVFSFIRIATSLYIGAVILVTQFSMTWETAATQTRTKYKAGTGQEVNVTIGVYIGLKGVNITLKGEPEQIKGEKIDYNEHFSWDSQQGRIGFGPFAGQFNQEYRAAQFRGLPLPILWAAEYFTFDGEGIRWGRFYRQAGWYSHIILWLAFPMWVLTNVLFCVLLRYGAYFLALTGLSMLTSTIIWATLRNVNELVIPYTDTAKLEFSYGGSFWICLLTGVTCVVLSVVIFVLDKLFPTMVATFFSVDVLQDSEKIQVEGEDQQDETKTCARTNGTGPAAAADGDPSTSQGEFDDDEDELYLPPPPTQLSPNSPNSDSSYVITTCKYKQRSYRSGESRMTKKFQKPRRRAPPPHPDSQKEDNGEPFDNFVLQTMSNVNGDEKSDEDEEPYVSLNAEEMNRM